MVSDSRLNMWRAVIALAHADHVLKPEEVKFIEDKIKHGKMDDKQIALLLSDSETPAKLEDVLPKVTEPSDRSMLVYYARLLVWSDGEYALQEERLLDVLRNNALGSIDLERELSEARIIAERHATEYEEYLERETDFEEKGWAGKTIGFFADIMGRI